MPNGAFKERECCTAEFIEFHYAAQNGQRHIFVKDPDTSRSKARGGKVAIWRSITHDKEAKGQLLPGSCLGFNLSYL